MFKRPLRQTVWTQIRLPAVWSRSTLFASILQLVSNARQLFAADDFSRRHFSDAFFSWRFKGKGQTWCGSFNLTTWYKYISIQIKHKHANISAVTCDFQQCGILTSVDSDVHVQPPFKLKVQMMFGQKLYIHGIFKPLAKALIRLRVCAGYSEALLLAQVYWATACDFQQCGILTSVDSDKPLQPPFQLRNSKCCWVSSLTVIEYSSD